LQCLLILRSHFEQFSVRIRLFLLDRLAQLIQFRMPFLCFCVCALSLSIWRYKSSDTAAFYALLLLFIARLLHIDRRL
jgi:hypothetical protein